MNPSNPKIKITQEGMGVLSDVYIDFQKKTLKREVFEPGLGRVNFIFSVPDNNDAVIVFEVQGFDFDYKKSPIVLGAYILDSNGNTTLADKNGSLTDVLNFMPANGGGRKSAQAQELNWISGEFEYAGATYEVDSKFGNIINLPKFYADSLLGARVGVQSLKPFENYAWDTDEAVSGKMATHEAFFDPENPDYYFLIPDTIFCIQKENSPTICTHVSMGTESEFSFSVTTEVEKRNYSQQNPQGVKYSIEGNVVWFETKPGAASVKISFEGYDQKNPPEHVVSFIDYASKTFTLWHYER